MRYDYRANGASPRCAGRASAAIRSPTSSASTATSWATSSTSPLGVAEATSRLAGFVLDAPATYDDEKKHLFEAKRDAMFEKADAANKEHRQTLLEKQAAKLDWVRTECEKRVEGGYDEARTGPPPRRKYLSSALRQQGLPR